MGNAESECCGHKLRVSKCRQQSQKPGERLEHTRFPGGTDEHTSSLPSRTERIVAKAGQSTLNAINRRHLKNYQK